LYSLCYKCEWRYLFFVEKARLRKTEQTLTTNHGGVCLLYDASFHARALQLPKFQTFEAVGAYIHRAGFNVVVIVIYRPGSQSVTQVFSLTSSDLLERLAVYSTPLMILGDFNIHMDDATDTSASKLSDILVNHSLQQHVKSPTHSDGHTLDLFITRNDHLVSMLPTDPPLLSDHAFVVADCVCPSPPDESTSHRTVRNWRSLDIDAFAADLHMSALVVSPPEDVDAAFACYDTTLRSLLDKHAPLELKRIRTRSSARWYDRQ